MPIKLHRLPEEPILIATIGTIGESGIDIPTMFKELIQMRQEVRGPVALILDFSHAVDRPDAFSYMVMGLAEASRGIRASRATVPTSPPITIFVGSDQLTELAAQAVGQEQYGGAQGELCATVDDAIALARAKLKLAAGSRPPGPNGQLPSAPPTQRKPSESP